jgi:hypothetical protein
MVTMNRLLLLILLGMPLVARDWYLFTSFRKNGESGVYFAMSADGRNWTPLNGDKPWLAPEHPGMLMRDPFLTQGPDHTWHLLWTCRLEKSRPDSPLTIGYARSSDLIAWTAPREIAVMANEPTARNVWAPEAVWDSETSEWVVFWASSIPGKFGATDGPGETGFNHRIYVSRTRDWDHFTPAKLYLEPGFSCANATVARAGKRWAMIFNDAQNTPEGKHLYAAFANSLEGPWQWITKPFARATAEGPSVMEFDHVWWIYFEAAGNPKHYSAIRTHNWRHFDEVNEEFKFPPDHRHGTIVTVRGKTARPLESQRR